MAPELRRSMTPLAPRSRKDWNRHAAASSLPPLRSRQSGSATVYDRSFHAAAVGSGARVIVVFAQTKTPPCGGVSEIRSLGGESPRAPVELVRRVFSPHLLTAPAARSHGPTPSRCNS